MTLEIAEGAVVRQDVEAVGSPFERAARLVTAVRPISNIRSQQMGAVV